MKEKVIEAAGKAWQFLGKNGETSITDLARLMKEKQEIVLQALGWLAREDKINYTIRNQKNFVSLVENEFNAFQSTIQNIGSATPSPSDGKQRNKARFAGRI